MRNAGLSNAEIASALGMTRTRVRGLLSETLKRHGKHSLGIQMETLDLPLNGLRKESTASGFQTHLVIPDTQCKPGVPLDHLLWAGRYAAEKKPDVVIHIGDHWDMPSLSSYEKKGSKFHENRRVREDIDSGNEGLRLFEEGLGDWQPKLKIIIRGNHEDRITRALNEDPRLEGIFGFEDFNDTELGWEVVDYLKPITIDGVTYSHYFYRPGSGSPYSGTIDTMLKQVGFTFTMGHQQGLRWGRRELSNGRVQIGCVAGSFYQHNEEYRGPQAASEWRGIVLKHEVFDGDYDPMFVSLNYLRRKYG